MKPGASATQAKERGTENRPLSRGSYLVEVTMSKDQQHHFSIQRIGCVLRRTGCVILIILFLTGLVFCTMLIAFPRSGSFNKPGTLIVNGTEILDDRVRIYRRFEMEASLPFTTILSEFGCSVEWTGEESALITVSSQDYELIEGHLYRTDEEKPAFIGEKKNIVATDKKDYIPSEESGCWTKYEGGELYMNSPCLAKTMENLGLTISISIDQDNRVVYVNGNIQEKAP